MYSTQGTDGIGLAFWDYLVTNDWVTLNSITQASFQYNVPKTNLNVLGRPTSQMVIDGPVDTSLSFSKNITSDDNIWGHTGRSDLQFNIMTDLTSDYGTSGIYVTGAINSISVQANVGEVPQMSVDAILYTNGFYSFADANTVGTSQNLYVPATGIQLNVGGQNGTNAIASASFSANFNWVKENRINSPGSGQRFIMELTRPIDYSATVEVILDDYKIDQFSFTNPKTWELKIYSDTALIETFTLDNAELIGESLSLTPDGVQSVSLTYKGVG